MVVHYEFRPHFCCRACKNTIEVVNWGYHLAAAVLGVFIAGVATLPPRELTVYGTELKYALLYILGMGDVLLWMVPVHLRLRERNDLVEKLGE
jgi:hypothetical protein